jgi:hypothetical protein
VVGTQVAVAASSMASGLGLSIRLLCFMPFRQTVIGKYFIYVQGTFHVAFHNIVSSLHPLSHGVVFTFHATE